MTLALIPIVLGLVVNLATSTFEVKAAWWPPLVWTIVVLLTAVSVLSQAAAARSTPADRQGDLDKVVADLRGTINRQWRDEAVRVLGLERDPMPVRWNLVAQPGFTADPNDIASTAGPNQIGITGETVWSGSGDQIGAIVDYFRALERPRLVVLGGPGAGKTTLAIQLLRRLLNDPRADEPVPVLLTLTGWDRSKHPHFEDWLAARLEQRYSSLSAAGPGTALTLFRSGRIMPILDGLDEVHSELLPDVLNAINDALEASSRIVVTCRTPEYLQAVAAGQSIADAALVSAQPLSAAVAAASLKKILDRTVPHPGWHQVLNHLRGDTPSALTEVVASPLGLWLTSTTYVTPGTDPTPLLEFATPAALRSHLFNRLVPALIAARSPAGPDDADLFRPRRVYEASDVTRWLGFLARVLASQPSTERGIGRPSVGKRELAWWELAAAVTPGYPPGWRVTVAVTVTSATWGLVIGGLVLGFGLWTALVGGMGLFFGYREGPGHRDHGTWLFHSPARADLRLGGGRAGLLLRKVLSDLAIWIAVLAAAGAVSGVVGYFSSEGALPHMLGAVLLLGPALVLAAVVNAVVAWAESPAASAEASTPLTTWRADRTLNLFRIVLGGAGGAICGGFMLSLTDQPAPVVVVGTALTVGAGLVYGLVSGGHHAWLVFATAQRRLARQKALPSKLMTFLDDAHRLGLLRAVGPIYQFRHAEFQDHLAHPPVADALRQPYMQGPLPTASGDVRPFTLRTFAAPLPIASLAFTRDGTHLAVAGPGAVLLLDLDGEPVHRFRFDRMYAAVERVVEFALDLGDRLSLQSVDSSLRSGGGSLALNGHGLVATIGVDWPSTRVWIFDLAGSRAPRTILYDRDTPEILAFHPAGEHLMIGTAQGLSVLDASDAEVLRISPDGSTRDAAFSPDGTRLVTIGSHRFAAGPCTIEIWDSATGVALFRVDEAESVTTVAYSPDGRLIATAGSTTTRVREAETGEELNLLSGFGPIAFSPDGSLLATATSAGATIWDVASGAAVAELPDSLRVTALAFSPDGKLLAIVRAQRDVHLLDLHSISA